MFCQNCGCVIAQPPGMSTVSARVVKLQREQASRCMCSMPTGEILEEEVMKHERALEEMLESELPGIKARDLPKFVQMMDRAHPLRAEVVQRLQFIQRLKERQANPDNNMPTVYAPNEQDRAAVMKAKMEARPGHYQLHSQLHGREEEIFGMQPTPPAQGVMDWAAAFGATPQKKS